MSGLPKRLLAPVVAILALAYLVAMVVSGALPETRQLIRFEAKGVLERAPKFITRVTVSARSTSSVFVRQGAGWVTETGTGAVNSKLAKTIERALKIMHNSGPVRVLAPADIADAGPAEFGLDRPRLSVMLADSSGVALEAEFGANNTDGMLQYMRLKGRDRLYLMSNFVGQEWEKIAAAEQAPDG